jgi:hypothetical protein
VTIELRSEIPSLTIEWLGRADYDDHGQSIRLLIPLGQGFRLAHVVGDGAFARRTLAQAIDGASDVRF